MTLEEADIIRKDWGKFLEITNGSLMMLFFTKIPESFLPYPKETIEEALNVVAEHFHNLGNAEAVNTVQATIPFLMSYVPDKEAIEQLKTNLSNQKYVDVILPNLGEKQREQLKYIQGKK